jgi:raffinose/stachyose/melibiose transport system permease protein
MRISRTVRYTVLVFFSALAFYPFLWVILTSLKDNFEVYSNAFGLPTVWKIENYINAWSIGDFGVNFFNSVLVSAIATTGVSLLAAMAAYSLARVKENPLIYVFMTIGIMIPIHALLIPTFVLVRGLGIMNTRLGLILVYTATNMSLSVFILVGFMRGIPRALEESALIEGASWSRIFFSIVFPLAKPGIATIGTLAFLNCWNEFVYATVLIASPELRTLPLGIAALRGQYFTDFGIMCAGLAIAVVPVMILFVVFQEHVIRGMAAGAVKG